MIIALILHRIVDVRVPVKCQEFGKYYICKSLDSKIVLTLMFIWIFRRVRTLYACMAENDGELSFEPNQIITNGKIEMWNVFLIFIQICNKIYVITVKASLEPGWLEGTLNGKTGLVPKNYVEQLP